MTGPFRLQAQSGSTYALHADLLFTAMLLLCGAVALVLLVLIVTFAWRYRHSSTRPRRAPRPLRGLEVAWTLAPLLIFIALFGWSAREFIRLWQVPADALPVMVLAKQWMWKLQHRNGRREINELHVPLGRPVHLLMTSQDAIHSFSLPGMRLKQDVLPGRYTSLWFEATQLGSYPLYCAEYCGTQHAGMIGRVVVMTPADYARWLDAGTPQPSLARQGLALARAHGCTGCHDARSTVHAPSLDGLIGRRVTLQDGRSLVADANYVRDAILQPGKDVVAGFAPVMPSFAGQLDEEQILALIAWIGRPAGEPP